MKFVIVGCGRVGSILAESLDKRGHEVIIFDLRTSAFDRLPEDFKGAAIRGDGTDEEVLRNGGAEGADIFLALTEGDNRNIMASQLAAETLGIPRVIAKINDPVRADAYAELGLATLCRTNLMVDSISGYLDVEMPTGPGIKAPTSGHAHPHDSEPLGSQPLGGRSVGRASMMGPADGADALPGQPGQVEAGPLEGTAETRPNSSRGFFRRGRE